LKNKLNYTKFIQKKKPVNFTDYEKDIETVNNKRLQYDMNVIKKILQKRTEGSLPNLHRNRSGSLLESIITNCHSYEDISPRDQCKIDEDR